MLNSLENYIRSVISPSSAAAPWTQTSELIIISHAMSNENNKKNLWAQTHKKKQSKMKWMGFEPNGREIKKEGLIAFFVIKTSENKRFEKGKTN